MDSKDKPTYKIPKNISRLLFHYLETLNDYDLVRIEQMYKSEEKSSDVFTSQRATEILLCIEEIKTNRFA